MWVMLLFLMFLCLHNRRSGRTPANHSTHLTNQTIEWLDHSKEPICARKSVLLIADVRLISVNNDHLTSLGFKCSTYEMSVVAPDVLEGFS